MGGLSQGLHHPEWCGEHSFQKNDQENAWYIMLLHTYNGITYIQLHFLFTVKLPTTQYILQHMKCVCPNVQECTTCNIMKEGFSGNDNICIHKYYHTLLLVVTVAHK